MQKTPKPRTFYDNRGAPAFSVSGVETSFFTDLYHRVLLTPWRVFFGIATALYLSTHLFFGALYYLSPASIMPHGTASYLDCVFFSVQTLMTIGYGVMSPQNLYAHILVTAEAYVGLFATAMLTGLVFSKFARPNARVMFTNVICVSDHDGVPSLLFRAANARGNRIVEASLNVALARTTTTKEGERFRRVEDLVLRRRTNPLFFVTWTAIHSIDSTSPLYGLSAEDLKKAAAEIIVVLLGMDETSSQTVHARKTYEAADFRFAQRFADILEVRADGTRHIDYNRFHDTIEHPLSYTEMGCTGHLSQQS